MLVELSRGRVRIPILQHLLIEWYSPWLQWSLFYSDDLNLSLRVVFKYLKSLLVFHSCGSIQSEMMHLAVSGDENWCQALLHFPFGTSLMNHLRVCVAARRALFLMSLVM